jgi:hypothetical protein
MGYGYLFASIGVRGLNVKAAAAVAGAAIRFGASSIVAGWVGVLCQVDWREIGSGGAGLVRFGGGWGVDMRILGCFGGWLGRFILGRVVDADKSKRRSRFPEGMTERKARTKTRAEADPPPMAKDDKQGDVEAVITVEGARRGGRRVLEVTPSILILHVLHIPGRAQPHARANPRA